MAREPRFKCSTMSATGFLAKLSNSWSSSSLAVSSTFPVIFLSMKETEKKKTSNRSKPSHLPHPKEQRHCSQIFTVAAAAVNRLLRFITHTKSYSVLHEEKYHGNEEERRREGARNSLDSFKGKSGDPITDRHRGTPTRRPVDNW